MTDSIADPQQTLFDLLASFNAATSIGSEDLLAAVLPLLVQTHQAHAEGRVAPLAPPDALRADHGHLWFQNAAALAPRLEATVLARRRADRVSGIRIIEEVSVESDDVTGRKVSDLLVTDTPDSTPRYLTGYRSWEVEAGHHDPLTDIFSLGMLIGSLATGLDLRKREPLELFVRHRADLTKLNRRLHPVICRVVERMTALERHDRAQDLPALIATLENHRAIDPGLGDAPGGPAFRRGKAEPRDDLLRRLRARLYDLTRRNRLVFHRPTASELNLTETSVPLVIDPKAIRPDDLFTARSRPMQLLLAGKEVTLGEFLRFEEMLFAPSVLSRLRADADRDAREFGASQLRLVPVFLRWHDLKNAPEAAISSPLLLMRVTLKRRKGVRDAFTLALDGTVAEVNPALAFLLERLYNIQLPASVDLADDTALATLHRLIETQIKATEPGVVLEYSDRPRMRLLHQKVRRRLDQFNKRQIMVTKGLKSRAGMTYSYDRPGYNPLGVQLFHEFVRLAEAPSRDLTGRTLPRQFNRMDMVEAASVTELSRTMLQHVDETRSRFEWAFDLCSVTLSNFNYRKMSLVRDYNDLLAGAESQTANFDLFFSSAPRQAEEMPLVVAPESRYPVIALDPSQDRAVLRARTGQSYVIQGPPGTGKSQTIANLIADTIGRGKRVLFVCEKRAALDVVFNRLKGVGLGSMCALVHDSQENKRDFIKELEQIYTSWSDLPPRFTESQIETQRRAALERIASVTQDVRLLVRTMTGPAAGSAIALHDVLEQALSQPPVAVAADQRPLLPDLSDWAAARDAVQRGIEGLRRMTGATSLAARPERLITAALWESDGLRHDLPPVLDRLMPRLAALAGHPQLGGTVADALGQISLAARLAPLAQAGRLAALATDTPDARALRDGLNRVQDLGRALAAARTKTAAWRDRLSPTETEAALRLAQVKEGRLFAFLSGDWRQLKRVMAQRVDLAAMVIRPRITDLLADLQAEHHALAAHDQAAQRLARDHGFDSFPAFAALLADLEARLDPAAQALLDAVRGGDPGIPPRILSLAALATQTQGLLAETKGLLTGLDRLPLTDAPEAIATLQGGLPLLVDLQHLMAPLAAAPDSIWDALRRLPFSPVEMDSAVLHETIRRSLLRAPGLATIDAPMLAAARAKVTAARTELESLNARLLETRAIQRFRAGMVLTNTPDRDLSPADRAQKSALAQARRALEHEFGKTRAYRSIRELLDGPARALLPDLKPIWLMSPLSVADVLPLAGSLFDVVIFDEASQIPVEDAVPTLVRAPQVIVVGDEKQLPPTNFFGATSGEEDFDTAEEEDPDFELDQDSFLALSGERLSSVMLSWHYRSRSEELIGFSNAAFYRERLLTIPSTGRLLAHPPISVPDPSMPPVTAADLRQRPVSFHHLPFGLYSARRNAQEAVYIARLLRSLLAEGSGKTFGIVAFSEAQQSEIETALAALAGEDPAFARALEQERDREQDGEFIGLFVKNLENVQGDERDVILLSICYGPDHSGKMRMNFGPINKMGGERRLNVIFSRAKENMVVVSSITSEAISNDYNLGANTLKTFLRYAEALSVGDEDGARLALRKISSGAERAESTGLDLARAQIAARLRAAGVEVREGLGLSTFTVDLALRAPGADRHQTAVLLDTAQRYRTGGLDEVLLARASLLERFGWQVVTVPLKDWWQDPDRVIATVLDASAT